MPYRQPNEQWLAKVQRTDVQLFPDIECPTCKTSGAVLKIPTGVRVVSALLFGLLGNMRKKQFACGFCGYKW